MNKSKKKNAILVGLVACLLVISIANYTVFYKSDASSVSNIDSEGPGNATLVSNISEEDAVSYTHLTLSYFDTSSITSSIFFIISSYKGLKQPSSFLNKLK